MSPHNSVSNNKKLHSLVVKDISTTVPHSRTIRGKFPKKSIVPISGNKGIVNYKHMRELQEMKSNYSRDSADDDKLS